jgi:hypothetical protein
MSDNSGLVVAALAATEPSLAGNEDSQTSWREALEEQGARVLLYRKYEEGEHRSGITPQMKLMLRLEAEASGLNDFNDNYCQIIVDKMAGRLHISKISTKSETVDQQWLTPLLEQNDFEALQGRVFRAAIREGDSYVMVNPMTLKWSAEPAFDGFSGMVAVFDDIKKTAVWACKLWSEGIVEEAGGTTSVMKIVVYQPNKISYFVGDEGGSEVTPDNKVVETIINEKETITNETNVRFWPVGKTPIVRFANKTDNYSAVGKSELRPAIPLQDALNRTLHSMVMASEFSAFRLKWSIGMEIDERDIMPGAVINLVVKGEDGKPVTEMTEEAARFLAAVRVGQFEETDIGQYITQIDKLAREVSQVSQTPIYGVTTEGVLSGEALKQLEIGLIGKVERFQRDNADSVRELIQLTAEIQSSFVNTKVGFPSAPKITAVSLMWKPAELLDTHSRIEILIKMRKEAPGLWDDSLYQNEIGSLLGMSQERIESESTKAAQSQANLLESLVGGGGGIPVV